MRKIVLTDKQSLVGRRFDVNKLAEILNDAVLDGGREPHDRAKKSFAPSGVGYGAGTCARRWWYDFHGGVMRVEDADAMSIANMDYGTEAHARIQKQFEKTGLLVETEKKVDTTKGGTEFPPILGFVDLVINWQGEQAVGEIKTTSQESFVSKASKQQAVGYHLLQVLIYMKVLGLNKGFLLYENKNTQQLLILPVAWNVANTKLIDDTFAWMHKVYDNAFSEDGGLPTRPARSEKSVICKSCPFRKHCWEDEEGVVDLPVLEVPK